MINQFYFGSILFRIQFKFRNIFVCSWCCIEDTSDQQIKLRNSQKIFFGFMNTEIIGF